MLFYINFTCIFEIFTRRIGNPNKKVTFLFDNNHCVSIPKVNCFRDIYSYRQRKKVNVLPVISRSIDFFHCSWEDLLYFFEINLRHKYSSSRISVLSRISSLINFCIIQLLLNNRFTSLIPFISRFKVIFKFKLW